MISIFAFAGTTYSACFRGWLMLEYSESKPRVALCLFGEGAASKGDVWEAMISRVLQKLVFVANKKWAISVPLKLQTASQTLAQKAIASGFVGEQVDGNDVITMRAAGGEAMADAPRAGKGPRVEAVTYRCRRPCWTPAR